MAAAGAPMPLALDPASLIELRSQAPKKLTWQILDHCAAISRIYALYERGIEDLVAMYMGYLPQVSPSYAGLAESLRIQHRVGVGQILLKWSPTHPVFGSINEPNIAAGLADGLRARPYSLLTDAFLIDPENLRTSALTRLFRGLGFENSFAWVRKYDVVRIFCAAKLTGTATADSFLDEFVRIRNEAAHGNVSNIAGVTLISDYTQFIGAVAEALAALLRTHLVRAGTASNCATVLGDVVHAWSGHVVGVRAVCGEAVAIGDRLYAGTRDILPVTIQSLRIGKVDHPSLLLHNGFEFGLQLDRRVPEGARIYRWKI